MTLKSLSCLVLALLVTLVPRPTPADGGASGDAPPDMVFVEGGCFEMGDPLPQKDPFDGDPDEKPLHEVCLDPFFIGRYEVTVGEFRRFIEETGYRTDPEREGLGCFVFDGGAGWRLLKVRWDAHVFAQGEDHPVVCVSWNDATEYARWLSRKEGKTFRLPTEAEWEYAAKSRGEAPCRYTWCAGRPSGNIGDESLKREFPGWPRRVWEGYDDGYVYTAPVGSFAPNGLGVHDMAGNVWEWVDDWYNGDFYRTAPRHNPRAPKTDFTKVRRGGAWSEDTRHVRIVNRSRNVPVVGRFDLGFRLVMEP